MPGKVNLTGMIERQTCYTILLPCQPTAQEPGCIASTNVEVVRRQTSLFDRRVGVSWSGDISRLVTLPTGPKCVLAMAQTLRPGAARRNVAGGAEPFDDEAIRIADGHGARQDPTERAVGAAVRAGRRRIRGRSDRRSG